MRIKTKSPAANKFDRILTRNLLTKIEQGQIWFKPVQTSLERDLLLFVDDDCCQEEYCVIYMRIGTAFCSFVKLDLSW